MRSIGLRAKLLMWIIGVIVVSGLLVVVSVRAVLSQSLTETLHQRTISLIQHVAEESGEYLLKGDRIGLRMLYDERKEAIEDIRYIFAVDPENKTLEQTFKKGFPLDLRGINNVSEGREYSISRILLGEEKVFDVAVPIFEGELGTLHMGISEEPINVCVSNVIKLITGIIVAILAVGVLLTFFFANAIIRPILKLVRGAEAVSMGNLDYKVSVDTKDEIGQLSKAFDKMTAKVRESHNNLRDKLLRSEKLALIGKLAGEVAHEIRNPLGVIRNSVYFIKLKLADKIDDEKVKQHFDILDAEIDAVNKIISDVLTFGRIKEPQFSKIDINDVVRTFFEREKARVPENIEMNIDLGNDLPKIRADNKQLYQVVSNIILNAIQSMVKGGELTVQTTSSGGFVGMDISDSGEGILKENIDKIFDPLFSTKIHGTGLGLSVCKSIIDMHKGEIDIKSEIGKGTKFMIKFPVKWKEA